MEQSFRIWQSPSARQRCKLLLGDAGTHIGVGLAYTSEGIYWSSSLDSETPCRAHYVTVNSTGVGRSYYYRCNGFSVLPVTE